MQTTPSIYQRIISKQASIAVIGMGYVGLPIALEFARDFKVIGFDINHSRIDSLQKGIDPNNEMSQDSFADKDIVFTSTEADLKAASCYIVAVPSPIDQYKLPDLTAILSASKIVGENLSKGDYVIFESTVYPGCTEDDCIPVLEKQSGLIFKTDFKVGYSPERINPGDNVNTIRNIHKVVSGCDVESGQEIAQLYSQIIDAGVHLAPSIKVAEASKIAENTQRDVNIALINELSIIFNKMGISTLDVLKAAGTKWNFHPYTPGLVGGHCIGVDPYYISHKAKNLGYHAKVINSGRYVNDSMGFYVGKQMVKKIIAKGKNILGARVLVMGATFKENVADIRNSKVVDVVSELQSFGVQVDVTDPLADSEALMKEYGFGLTTNIQGKYDGVLVAVNHKAYLDFTEEYFLNLMDTNGVLVDIKGIYNQKIQQLTYWTL